MEPTDDSEGASNEASKDVSCKTCRMVCLMLCMYSCTIYSGAEAEEPCTVDAVGNASGPHEGDSPAPSERCAPASEEQMPGGLMRTCKLSRWLHPPLR